MIEQLAGRRCTGGSLCVEVAHSRTGFCLDSWLLEVQGLRRLLVAVWGMRKDCAFGRRRIRFHTELRRVLRIGVFHRMTFGSFHHHMRVYFLVGCCWVFPDVVLCFAEVIRRMLRTFAHIAG